MNQIKTRRSFLKIAGGLAVAAPFIAKFPRASAAAKRFDPSFGTATEAAVAIWDVQSKDALLPFRVPNDYRAFQLSLNRGLQAYDEIVWAGLAVPAATPKPVVQRA